MPNYTLNVSLVAMSYSTVVRCHFRVPVFDRMPSHATMTALVGAKCEIRSQKLSRCPNSRAPHSKLLSVRGPTVFTERDLFLNSLVNNLIGSGPQGRYCRNPRWGPRCDLRNFLRARRGEDRNWILHKTGLLSTVIYEQQAKSI